MNHPCFYCSGIGDLCPHCDQIGTCNEHKSIHRPIGLNFCLPIKVSHDPRKGRILLASRDILAKEIVLFDRAAVVGPNTHPVCLGCMKKVESDKSRSCPKCDFPSCGNQECLKNNSHLDQECPIFAKSGFKPRFQDPDAPYFVYTIISILRLILVIKRNPDTSKLGTLSKANAMKSHLDSF